MPAVDTQPINPPEPYFNELDETEG